MHVCTALTSSSRAHALSLHPLRSFSSSSVTMSSQFFIRFARSFAESLALLSPTGPYDRSASVGAWLSVSQRVECLFTFSLICVYALSFSLLGPPPAVVPPVIPLSPSLSQTGGLSVRVDDECRRVGAHGMLWRWL